MSADAIIKVMKERIPNDPYLKEVLNKLMDDGLSEEEALDLMITEWLANMGFA